MSASDTHSSSSNLHRQGLKLLVGTSMIRRLHGSVASATNRAADSGHQTVVNGHSAANVRTRIAGTERTTLSRNRCVRTGRFELWTRKKWPEIQTRKKRRKPDGATGKTRESELARTSESKSNFRTRNGYNTLARTTSTATCLVCVLQM